jgi:hypothetical protein
VPLLQQKLVWSCTVCVPPFCPARLTALESEPLCPDYAQSWSQRLLTRYAIIIVHQCGAPIVLVAAPVEVCRRLHPQPRSVHPAFVITVIISSQPTACIPYTANHPRKFGHRNSPDRTNVVLVYVRSRCPDPETHCPQRAWAAAVVRNQAYQPKCQTSLRLTVAGRKCTMDLHRWLPPRAEAAHENGQRH